MSGHLSNCRDPRLGVEGNTRDSLLSKRVYKTMSMAVSREWILGGKRLEPSDKGLQQDNRLRPT